MHQHLSEFDVVMEQIGFGKVHLFATVTLGLLQMMAILETMGMGIIGPAAVCDLRMSLMQLTSILAAGFMGIICSSYFWGYITDKMGRRWILLRTISVSNICSVISMFMVSFSGFYVMRFMTGIFVAGPSFVAVTYLSEFCNKQIMSRAVTHLYMFTGFAMLYSPAWGTLFQAQTYMDFELVISGRLTVRPWRILGCMFTLPGLIAFFLLLRMPESPKFLFMIGETQKGMDVMDWVCRKNTGRSLNPEQVANMLKFQKKVEVKRQQNANNILLTMLNDAMPLFRKPYVWYFVSGCAVMFVMGLLANGLGIWYTSMRNRANMRIGPKEHMTLCSLLFDNIPSLMKESEEDLNIVCNDDLHSFNDSLILGATYIILYNVCWLLLFYVPRKALLVTSLVIASTCGFAIIFVSNHFIQLFSLIFLVSFPGLIISLMGGALLEFVPTYIRAKALCISLMWCRWGAAVGATIVGSSIEKHCEITLLAMAILPLFAASLESFLPL
ncbi:GL27291 [Drosophila persimilis]|uniref:GL27291 n=1 Tax=Drosophila persimilis TaxID=7234 RepID=B4GZ28_DROPE|nr:synaptic vesicle glycoprotein 2C isoform X1 [Drosophila persimilis]EDW28046.1 GL27291 [Drosophila persimilis]